MPRFSSSSRQRLEQLRRGEHAADVVAGAEDRDGLIDAVILYGSRCSIQPFLISLITQRGSRSTQKQMPPRCWHEVLDRQPQPPRTGGAEHQPVRALGEILVGQRLAEQLVVDAEVFDRRCGSWECRWCRRSRRRRSAFRDSPSAPSGAPGRREAIRPRTAETGAGRRRPGSPCAGPSRASPRSPARTGSRSRG